MERDERIIGNILQTICLDGVGEHKGEIKSILETLEVIGLEYSPGYSSQRNGLAERIIQELRLRARIVLIGTEMKHEFWAEEVHHGNWFRNQLPSSRIDESLTIHNWKPKTVIHHNISSFGQTRYSFIHSPSTDNNKTFSANAVHNKIVGMERDERLCRVLDTNSDKLYVVRLEDLKLCEIRYLSPFSTILDGRFSQREEELLSETDVYAAEVMLEEYATEAMDYALSARKKRKGPWLPSSFI